MGDHIILAPLLLALSNNSSTLLSSELSLKLLEVPTWFAFRAEPARLTELLVYLAIQDLVGIAPFPATMPVIHPLLVTTYLALWMWLALSR